MSTLTTDFTGTYCWPTEEAEHAARSLHEQAESDSLSREQVSELMAKELAHWRTVFGNNEQGIEDYTRFKVVFFDRMKPYTYG